MTVKARGVKADKRQTGRLFVRSTHVDDLYSIIRKAIRLLVTAIVLAVLLNDGIRVVTAFTHSSDGLKAGMSAALDSAKVAPQNVAGAQSAATAATAAQGATLVEYDQQIAAGAAVNNVRISLAVSSPVQRSLVAAPIIGMVRGVPAQDWYAPAGVDIVLRSTKQVNDFGVAP